MNNPVDALFNTRRLPAYLSSEIAECGLACLAMVGAFHFGEHVDLNALRKRFTLSTSGTTLRTIINMASDIGLSGRALRVDLDDIAHLTTPAVLHWDLSHFVVLKRVGKSKVVIHDPSRGVCTMSRSEFSKHFTGVVLELSPVEDFTIAVRGRPLRLTSLWAKSQGMWLTISQVLLLSIGIQIVTFAAPFQLQLVIDQAINRNDIELLVTLSVAFGALVLIQTSVDALRSWTLQILGNLLSYQMIGNLVHHILRLPSDFFEKRHVGDIMSRIGSTVAIRDVLTQGLVATVLDGTIAVLAGAILFVYSPLLAGIVVATLVVNSLATLAFLPSTSARTEESLAAGAAEQSHLMETVRASTTIKLFGAESQREGAWRNLYARTINASVRAEKSQIVSNYIQATLIGLQTVAVIYFGARSILQHSGFSVGMLLAFLSFRQTFSDRTFALLHQVVQLRLLRLHLDRLSDIVLAEPEYRATPAPPSAIRGEIELRDVSFRYGVGEKSILSSVSLKIRPGEFVAITGPSGGGKTTLLKLLLGLRVPTEGTVLLDGQPATPVLWRAWRTKLGVVAQDDRLLSGTVADNIAFFAADLDMNKVRDAAKSAFIHDDIIQMPMQYMSTIGDMGSSLSGGQKQRVLLARALYRDPFYLILDEGTANLDEFTERQIADLVSAMPISRVVVAHRPALLQRAQRVLTLIDGKLIEQPKDIARAVQAS